MPLLAAAPALPLHEAGKYVAGAYVVFIALIVVYVAIIGAKIARIDRELAELTELMEERESLAASCLRWASPTRRLRSRCARSWRFPKGGRYRYSES